MTGINNFHKKWKPPNIGEDVSYWNFTRFKINPLHFWLNYSKLVIVPMTHVQHEINL
jgi:hypothetical protein